MRPPIIEDPGGNGMLPGSAPSSVGSSVTRWLLPSSTHSVSARPTPSPMGAISSPGPEPSRPHEPMNAPSRS